MKAGKDRKKKRFLSEEDKDKICELYLDGITCDEIGKIMNSDPSWVVKIVKKRGVWKDKKERMRDVGFAVKITEDQTKKIIELNSKRKNYLEISERVGLSYDITARYGKKLGLKSLTNEELKRIYFLDKNWLNEINSPLKAIYLGLFFADGCNQKNTNECFIQLNEEDKYYLEKFHLLFTDKPLLKTRNMFRSSISSEDWSENLKNYGAVPAKSLILKWPNNLDENYYKYFIRGFFEGDGCISISKKKNLQNQSSYSFIITSTKEFLEKTSDVIEENLNIKPNIYKGNNKHDRNTFNLTIQRQKEIKKILDWIYSDYLDFAMKRKYNRYQLFLEERFPEDFTGYL